MSDSEIIKNLNITENKLKNYAVLSVLKEMLRICLFRNMSIIKIILMIV